MYYGADEAESYRRVAYYVDRILKGAKPADLPVEQPTKFELVINLKTAKQIGVTIAPEVLARANKLIKMIQSGILICGVACCLTGRFRILLMTIFRWIAMSESVELNHEKRVCFL